MTAPAGDVDPGDQPADVAGQTLPPNGQCSKCGRPCRRYGQGASPLCPEVCQPALGAWRISERVRQQQLKGK